MLQLGDAIPEITLPAVRDGEIIDINLAEAYDDKWLIVLFYPADFTFVCPTELDDAQKSYAKIQSLQAELVSISTDSVYAHVGWRASSPTIGAIVYPMLADPTGSASRAFGTYVEGTGMARRATYLFDPKGILRAFELHDDTIGGNIAETIRKLQAAQYTAKNPGLFCPANWQPGEAGITGTIDDVGRY